jgi:hypothetical protein
VLHYHENIRFRINPAHRISSAGWGGGVKTPPTREIDQTGFIKIMISTKTYVAKKRFHRIVSK